MIMVLLVILLVFALVGTPYVWRGGGPYGPYYGGSLLVLVVVIFIVLLFFGWR